MTSVRNVLRVAAVVAAQFAAVGWPAPPLDINRTNNTWTARPRAAEAARHWAARWMAWTQELLLTYALIR